MQVFHRFGNAWIPRLKNSFACACSHLCRGFHFFITLEMLASHCIFKLSEHMKVTRGEVWRLRYVNEAFKLPGYDNLMISWIVWTKGRAVCGRALSCCNNTPEVRSPRHSWLLAEVDFSRYLNKKYCLLSFPYPCNAPKLLRSHPRRESAWAFLLIAAFGFFWFWLWAMVQFLTCSFCFWLMVMNPDFIPCNNSV